MVDFEELINYIKAQDFYKNQILHIQDIPKKEAVYGKLKKPLRKRLQRWLDNNNIRLWRHQAEAINAIQEGKNTIIVTSTASGKSHCYNLSVLQTILDEDPKTTAIYVFPTKALARDQFTNLKKMMSSGRL